MKPEIQIIPKLWTTIPEAIRNRVGREPGPQRAMLEEENLLLILHQIPGPDDASRRPALFWRQPDGTWKSNPDAGGLMALQTHLNGFASRLDELDKAEHIAQTASEYHKVLEAIAPVLRSSRGLHRALQQAREFVKADRDLINLRDQAASIERNAELLLQDAQFGLNFTVAKQAEAQAQSAQRMANTSHRLNVLAALFLPLTALTGLFSMYVRGPLEDTQGNFWLIAIIGVLVGIVMSSVVVARR
jgi:Mg2+ and Co2+ transporter CorA